MTMNFQAFLQTVDEWAVPNKLQEVKVESDRLQKEKKKYGFAPSLLEDLGGNPSDKRQTPKSALAKLTEEFKTNIMALDDDAKTQLRDKLKKIFDHLSPESITRQTSYKDVWNKHNFTKMKMILDSDEKKAHDKKRATILTAKLSKLNPVDIKLIDIMLARFSKAKLGMEELIVGLILATGRRIGEVLVYSDFEPNPAFYTNIPEINTVKVTGILKKKTTAKTSAIIPVLIDRDIVFQKVAELRTQLARRFPREANEDDQTYIKRIQNGIKKNLKVVVMAILKPYYEWANDPEERVLSHIFRKAYVMACLERWKADDMDQAVFINSILSQESTSLEAQFHYRLNTQVVDRDFKALKFASPVKDEDKNVSIRARPEMKDNVALLALQVKNEKLERQMEDMAAELKSQRALIQQLSNDVKLLQANAKPVVQQVDTKADIKRVPDTKADIKKVQQRKAKDAELVELKDKVSQKIQEKIDYGESVLRDLLINKIPKKITQKLIKDEIAMQFNSSTDKIGDMYNKYMSDIKKHNREVTKI